MKKLLKNFKSELMMAVIIELVGLLIAVLAAILSFIGLHASIYSLLSLGGLLYWCLGGVAIAMVLALPGRVAPRLAAGLFEWASLVMLVRFIDGLCTLFTSHPAGGGTLALNLGLFVLFSFITIGFAESGAPFFRRRPLSNVGA